MEVLARSLLENTHFPTTATLTVAILFVITVFFTRRCRGLFSRGPWGLPLLGFYPFLRKDFHVHLRELGKKYGEAYLMSICGKHYLHIGSHQAFREAIVERADCFSDRSQEIGFLQHLFKDGVSFINGDPWKVWHKFLLQSMRELHIVPKGEIEGPLLDAIKSTLSALKENKGQPIDLSALLSLQCTEAVRRCIIGDRVSQETTLKLNQIYQKCTFLTGKKPALLCGSTARYLVLQWSKEFQELLSAKNEIDSILYAIINDHRLDFDPEHPRDLIDLYLKEKEMREKQNDPQAKYFNDKMFMGLLVLVYGESSYSLGALIAYYLKHLIGKTGVQNAIYEEIIREIGTEKLPNYNDRHKMPFTSSVVKEIQRMATHSPAEATRLATCDTTVSGVFVPEGTIVILNFYAINHDGSVYKNPDDFDPKRFMIEDKTKDSIPKSPVSFGSGKRACAGETLIKAEIFVFITAIMQNFTLYKGNTNDLNGHAKTNSTSSSHHSRFLAVPREDALFSVKHNT